MKLCRFEGNRLGRVDGDIVTDVTHCLEDLPRQSWPLPRGDLLIAALPKLRETLERAGGTTMPVDEIAYQSPVANPGTIFGAPLNYRDHIDEANADPTLNQGKTVPAIVELGLFLKATSSLCGPGEGITHGFPGVRVDHEVEVVAVIGKGGRNIPAASALEHVAGYCIVNDVSEREFQIERAGQWIKGKSYDTFGPTGPWLVTADEVPNPQKLKMWLDLNDERVQDGTTATMIFNVAHIVYYVSQFMTLMPGDLITTGTPPGVGMGMKPQRYLKPGDTMRLGIEGLGEQFQKVVRDKA